MLDVTMIGFGAIGSTVFQALENERDVRIAQIIVPQAKQSEVQSKAGAGVVVVSAIEALPQRPQFVLECAGHQALNDYIVPLLESGVDCALVSVGALAVGDIQIHLEAAAAKGGASIFLMAGALGGVDALSAARFGGLDSVMYTGRKPPLSWMGTPAEALLEKSGRSLSELREEVVIFQGNARDAARLYPKNANVAATLAIAGIGMELTQVVLIADPAIEQNIHQVSAHGAFGQMKVEMRGNALAENPKSSALTAYSIVRALKNQVRTLVI
jgi:aspartate dehydrogenase